MERNFFRKAVVTCAILLGTSNAMLPVYAAEDGNTTETEEVVIEASSESVTASEDIDETEEIVVVVESETESESAESESIEDESESAAETESIEAIAETESVVSEESVEVVAGSESEDESETETEEETAEVLPVDETAEEVETEMGTEVFMETETEFEEETETIEIEGLLDEEEFALLVENTTLLQETMEKYMTYRNAYENILRAMQSQYLPSGKNTDPSIKAEVHESLQASNCIINIDGILPKDVYITLTENSVTDDEGTVIQMSYTITYYVWDGTDYAEYEPSCDARNEWQVSFQGFSLGTSTDYTVQTYDSDGNLLQTDTMVGDALAIDMGQYTSDIASISSFLESDTIYGIDSAVFFAAYENGDMDVLNELIKQMAWNALKEQYPDIEFATLDEMIEAIAGMDEMLLEFQAEVETQLALQAQAEELLMEAAQQKLDEEALLASGELTAEIEEELAEDQEDDILNDEENETETIEEDEISDNVQGEDPDVVTDETADTEPVLEDVEDVQNETVEEEVETREEISEDPSDTEPATDDQNDLVAETADTTAENADDTVTTAGAEETTSEVVSETVNETAAEVIPAA